MRRRDILVGSMAVLAGRGTPSLAQPDRRFRLAFMHPSVALAEMPRWYGWLYPELKRLGYTEGQNLTFGFFSAEGRIGFEDQLAVARKVVQWHPDVIYGFTSGTVLALKAATSTIPIIGGVGDPVDSGIVDNIAHPGGNITGVTGDIGGAQLWTKRASMLHRITGKNRLGYLDTARAWDSLPVVHRVAAMRSAGVDIVGPPISNDVTEASISAGVEAIFKNGAEGMIVTDSGVFFSTSHARVIVDAIEGQGRPGIYGLPWAARLGGLIAYGPTYEDQKHVLAEQIDKILKGTPPGDIPFHEPAILRLEINEKTARALRIQIPSDILAQADNIIE